MQIVPIVAPQFDLQTLAHHLSQNDGEANSVVDSFNQLENLLKLAKQRDTIARYHQLAACFHYGFLVIEENYHSDWMSQSYIRPLRVSNKMIILIADLNIWRDAIVHHLRLGPKQAPMQWDVYIKIFELFETYGFGNLWGAYPIRYIGGKPTL